MGAQSKVIKSAASPSKSADPKTPNKLTATNRRLLFLFTCLETVLARPNVSPIDFNVVGKALNRSRGSVSGEYCRLRQSILQSQEREDQEDTIIDSPAMDKETAQTPDEDMITDAI